MSSRIYNWKLKKHNWDGKKHKSLEPGATEKLGVRHSFCDDKRYCNSNMDLPQIDCDALDWPSLTGIWWRSLNWDELCHEAHLQKIMNPEKKLPRILPQICAVTFWEHNLQRTIRRQKNSALDQVNMNRAWSQGALQSTISGWEWIRMDERCSRSSVILRVLKCRSHIVCHRLACVRARRLKRPPLLYALFCLTSTRKMTCAEGSTEWKDSWKGNFRTSKFQTHCLVWGASWRWMATSLGPQILEGTGMPTWPFRSSPLPSSQVFRIHSTTPAPSVC